ncbi:MAG TPA: ATP-binding protein [Terriglobales bacterium]|nr:ATP-binding protein [Terriglobales bacterium]
MLKRWHPRQSSWRVEVCRVLFPPGSSFARFAILCAALATLVVSSTGWAQDSGNPPKRVLLLYSFDKEEGTFSGFDYGLRSQLRALARNRVEFYTEYLDLVRFPGPAHAANLVQLLKLEFSKQKPDLIVPTSYLALQFLLGEGKDLFPGAPVVTTFNARRLDELKLRIATGMAGRGITGIASTDEPTGTLDLALRLQPDTQRVVVLGGSSPFDQSWRDQLKHDFSPYRQTVEVTYLTGLTMNELLRRVAQLPPHTVILSTIFIEDARGQFFLQEEALDLITRAANAPVYGIYSSYIGHGVVGGRMTDPENLGRRVAGPAGRVLNGENAASIPIVVDDSSQDIVDWRQLQQWHISEKRLPPATVELFREPSVWERDRSIIGAVIAFCILETALVFALLLNVGRRRRAEKALLREKTLADAVIESLPGIFLLQDKAGTNLRWNKNAERLARYRTELASAMGNIADQQKEETLRAREEIFEKGSGYLEVDVLAKDGGTVPYYFTGVRVELEGKPYLAAVGIDLSERRRAEEALRRSEADLRSFVEHAPYGIGAISVQQDKFLHANPALVRLLRYESEAEVLALTLSRDLYPEGGAGGFRAQPTGADFFNAVEFTWKRKDGKPVIVRASGRRISSPGSGGDTIEIIAEDITARRMLEEQLHHAQKMEALGQLAGSIAHDFNNLLGVIIGYSELLSSKLSSEAPAAARLEIIKKAGQRAASLTSQLLAFSRRQVLQPKVLNLNSLLTETQKMLQRLMREDVEQKILLDPALAKTKADPGQIVQVIMNLAVNARDAMPQGGTLTMKTANVSFKDAVSFSGVAVPPGEYVMLSVSDTGTGMDEETRRRIFEPFFTTKEAGKGTGLGLATVYGIVKQSGGYVFADSELGQGTTFTIYLPQVDQPIKASSQVAPAEFPPTSEVLLVVEDERAFRDLLHEGLQSKGYQVLVAANGVEALQIAEEYKGSIGVLITDVIMPKMSGPELAKDLKKVRPNTDVLYMSGYADDKLGHISESDGELTLIQKPFYIDDLVRKIQEILHRKDMHSSREVSSPGPAGRES